MHTILFILSGLVVISVGLIFLAKSSKVTDPEDDQEFHENVINMSNVPKWKKDMKKRVN